MSSAKSPTEAAEVDGPVGLGGWLILVGLGLVVSPIIVLNTIATDLLPLFQPDFWPVLTDPASEAYHPLWAPLLIFELAGNLLQVLVLLAALILFFQKSPHFPKVAIALYLGVLVFLIVDYAAAGFIPMVGAEEDFQSLTQISRQAVACLIWVPYMLRSKRVKNTFKSGRGSFLLGSSTR